MNKQRVLIVEDDAHLLRLYSKVLIKAGYEVHQAKNVDEAYHLLTSGPFAVFLCDIHIGKERGTELLREHKATLSSNGTNVIMVSAEPQYRNLCEDLGADFFLSKPVSLEDLTILVERLTTARGAA